MSTRGYIETTMAMNRELRLPMPLLTTPLNYLSGDDADVR